MEKYFQIAKCFRDEDLRADRQPEFTQIDIEASFVTPEDIFALTEGMLAAIFKAARSIEIKTPFERLTYREAISRYGSDKPDRRFAMQLVDLGDVFRESQFKVFRGALDNGGVVKAINAKGFRRTSRSDRRRTDRHRKDIWRERTRVHQDRERRMEIADREIFLPTPKRKRCASNCKSKKATCIFFAADKWDIACEVLGRLRLRIAEIQKLTENSEQLDFLWVTDFPLLQWSAEENKWNAVHHPFHATKGGGCPIARRAEIWRGARRSLRRRSKRR